MKSPLAAAYRPTNFDEVVGQTHLIGKNGVIRKMIDNNALSNMILYGPSGTGKTTIASIIASLTNKKLYPELETLFLTTGLQYMYLSSSIVRQVAALGGDISEFVCPEIQQEILQRLYQPKP